MSAALSVRDVTAIASSGDGRAPPHDLDAEAAVLSAIMLDADGADTLNGLRDFLAADHFFADAHRRIFEAACAVVDAGGLPDMVQIGSRLRATYRLAQIGGMQYLADILDAVPVVHRVENYATAVHEAWRVRQIITAAQTIAARGYLGIEGVQAFADDAVEALAKVARRSLTSPLERNLDALTRIVRELGERAATVGSKVQGMATGIASLDDLTGGLHAGHVFTIAGLPGDGKTTLALQIALNVARGGMGVLIFSTEQGRDELLLKLLSAVGRVDHDRFRDVRFSSDEWTRLIEAAREISALPIWIDDTTELDARTMRARATERASNALTIDRVPLGLVVVDYIQNLSAPAGAFNPKKIDTVTDAAKLVKAMARQLKVPVLSLAQRKRPDDKAPKNARPRLSDIADSSQVEKATDELLFVWNKTGDANTRTLTLAKQRGGSKGGDIPVRFEGKFSWFVDERREPVRDQIDDLIGGDE